MSNDPIKTTSPIANASPAPSPRIVQKLFIATNPLVLEKDKSIHAEHGAIHYPFYYGGLASCVSNCFTQPLGVGRSSISLV